MPRAAIIGSGPNGLSSAIALAQAGFETRVFEGQFRIGGGASTAEVTLPGFRHDLGSSIYPMGFASPFFKSLPLAAHGLRWIEPPAPLAHPLDDGTVVMLEHDLASTAANLGPDGPAYSRLLRPLVDGWADLCPDLLGPIIHWPSHPLLMAHFGSYAALPATALAKMLFRGTRARAIFAGNAAHSVLPLEQPCSSAVALVLSTAAHAGGWPMAAGGGQALSNALAVYLQTLGGKIITGRTITSLSELEEANSPDSVILCDISPGQLHRIAGNALPASYSQKLENFRHGPAAFKIDWALSQPIPWRATDCSRAATVHLGGTLEEIAASERAPWTGSIEERPFVLVTQPSLFDPGRAPEGKHTAWGYSHVPNGFTGDVTTQIENQVERFAPGFRDCILARRVWSPAALESWNPNLIGGDLSGGAMSLGQVLFRPSASLYRTPRKGLYLCSASTPPGGGVHGMCGFHAAKAVLHDLKRTRR